jgi:hypothetical protein
MDNKMIAVPFGADGFLGDSSFWVGDDLEVSEDAKLEECLAAHRANAESEAELEGDVLDEGYEAPVGFWLLDRKSLDTACVAYDADMGGSDTESYTCNRAAKHLCAHLAARVLGTFPDDGPEDE